VYQIRTAELVGLHVHVECDRVPVEVVEGVRLDSQAGVQKPAEVAGFERSDPLVLDVFIPIAR
jgi:hypothetical protein